MKKIYALLIGMAAIVLTACTAALPEIGSEEGYLTLEANVVTSTDVVVTRAVPSGYDAMKIYAEIVNAAGEVVESTDDVSEWENKTFKLMPGNYTINAHSAGWDGKDVGRDIPYYAGSTTVTIATKQQVTATLTCTLANVKVSVEFDEAMAVAFKEAYVEVTPEAAGAAAMQTFVMGDKSTLAPAYVPTGKLTARVVVVNKAGVTKSFTDNITNAKERTHYIFKVTTEKTGTGAFNITASGDETTYSYVFSVPTEGATQPLVNNVNAWSTFAWVEGTVQGEEGTIDPTKVKYQYKKATDADWTTTAATLDGSVYKATLKGLDPATAYDIKMVYDDAENAAVSAEKNFETEAQTPLPNGNMDSWHTGKVDLGGMWGTKNVLYPDPEGDIFWDTSNPGSSTMSKTVTSQETSDVHTPGGSAARLGSQYIVIKFAAASLYAGSFGELKGTNGASINFGRPWTTRPTALEGYFKYSTAVINRVGSVPAGVTVEKNKTLDLWSGYVVLTDELYTLDNTDIAGTAWDFATDPRVIAYGAMPDDKCVATSEYTKFNIELTYHDLNRKPKYLIVVFSSSKYGDYFTGSDKSVLLLDDLELIYGEPKN